MDERSKRVRCAWVLKNRVDVEPSTSFVALLQSDTYPQGQCFVGDASQYGRKGFSIKTVNLWRRSRVVKKCTNRTTTHVRVQPAAVLTCCLILCCLFAAYTVSACDFPYLRPCCRAEAILFCTSSLHNTCRCFTVYSNSPALRLVPF